MRVFVTGASGFIGSAVCQALLSRGHHVIGLARSEASAQALAEAGIEPFLGSLEDIDGLKRAAASADAVIHLAFVHDFSDFKKTTNVHNYDLAFDSMVDAHKACVIDAYAIEAIGDALVGSNKILIGTSGTLMLGLGKLDPERPSTELDTTNPEIEFPRKSEPAVLAYASRGVRAMVIRLPMTVHGKGDKNGFVAHVVRQAKANNVSLFVGEGKNRWAAVHRLDAAKLYVLAMEKGQPGAVYHAVHDQGVAIKDIAKVIGQGLCIPVESKWSDKDISTHFTFLSRFMTLDCLASAELTKKWLGWEPTHCTLLEDLKQGVYF